MKKLDIPGKEGWMSMHAHRTRLFLFALLL